MRAVAILSVRVLVGQRRQGDRGWRPGSLTGVEKLTGLQHDTGSPWKWGGQMTGYLSTRNGPS